MPATWYSTQASSSLLSDAEVSSTLRALFLTLASDSLLCATLDIRFLDPSSFFGMLALSFQVPFSLLYCYRPLFPIARLPFVLLWSFRMTGIFFNARVTMGVGLAGR